MDKHAKATEMLRDAFHKTRLTEKISVDANALGEILYPGRANPESNSTIAANDNHPPEDAFMVPTDVKAAIADEAKRIVTGARRSAYGKPEDNFARIAAYWNAYAQCKGWSVVFTAADVSPMMRGMKEARLVETPDHRDSFVDMVGYTLCGAEINGVAA